MAQPFCGVAQKIQPLPAFLPGLAVPGNRKAITLPSPCLKASYLLCCCLEYPQPRLI